MKFVAEVGSNWLGSLDRALLHIDLAAESGATGVKFQLFRNTSLYKDGSPELIPFELPRQYLQTLSKRARSQGLEFSVTPFAPELVNWLEGLVDEVKISAYDLTYHDLIWEAAKLKVPIVLSTAMATLDEIQDAIHVIPDVGFYPKITLLHGTACYPTLPRDANLRRISFLLDHALGDEIGLSDHTTGTAVPIAATALGATHIEKHFIVRSGNWQKSPDAPHSANPVVFSSMVQDCIATKVALGDRIKRGPSVVEVPLYKTCRRTNAQPLRRHS